MFFGLSGFAQTEKGKFLIGIGTSVGLGDNNDLMGLSITHQTLYNDSGSNTKIRENSFYLSSKIGFFMLNNLAGGLNLGLSTSSSNSSSSTFNGYISESSSSFFGVGPFLRYYVPTSRIFPFAEVSSLFGNRNYTTKTTGWSGEDKHSISNISGALGIAIMLGERSSLDLATSYNSTNLKWSDSNYKNITNTLGLKVGFTMFL